MTASRKKTKHVRKKLNLKALREQLRRGVYFVDSHKLTIALARSVELTRD